MKLEISKHIILDESAPKLPNCIFHRDGVILTQQISLDEIHMREFLIFLEYYSKEEFTCRKLKVSSAEFFEDIVLTY